MPVDMQPKRIFWIFLLYLFIYIHAILNNVIVDLRLYWRLLLLLYRKNIIREASKTQTEGICFPKNYNSDRSVSELNKEN